MSSSSREPVAGTYRHYKGALYEVLGVAEDPESGKRYVVYQSLGITDNQLDYPDEPKLGNRVVRNGSKGALAVASLKRFTEEVDGGDYSEGKRVARFELVSRAPRVAAGE
jgi:hypothetical protein